MTEGILYCSLIAKNEKVFLAESTLCASYQIKIKTLFCTITKGNVSDVLVLDSSNDLIVTYLRTKKIIFVCVSLSKDGEERPKRFMEQFVGLVVSDFGSLDNLIPQYESESNNNTLSSLCLQEKLESKLNLLIHNFDTGIYKNKEKLNEMNADLSEMKHNMSSNIKKIVGNNDDLQKLLLVSKNITNKSEEYKNNAKQLEYETKCIKPWMIYLAIILIVILIVYTICALYFCGNMWVICDRKKYQNLQSLQNSQYLQK
jgi:hypothetical protein